VDIIEKALKEKRSTLSEHEAKEFLKAYGIRVTKEKEVSSKEALLSALRELGFPLVLKASSAKIAHKTERGLVRLDVRTEGEAVSAFEDISNATREDGGAVLVQEMVRGPRELVVGLTRDVQFGPCVMFGLGGIFTEILHDVAFRVAPIEKRDALDMMQEIRGRKILEAVRGMPAADTDALAQMLITVGRIGLEQDRIKEIDLNPVILSGSTPIAVDALIVLES
jgi:acetyl-CoA synthetase (ADP-forming)